MLVLEAPPTGPSRLYRRRRHLCVFLAVVACSGGRVTAFSSAAVAKRSRPDRNRIPTEMHVSDLSSFADAAAAAASSHSIIITSNDDPLKYAFMLPTAVIIASSCQLAGIGGAALFSPVFLLVFPLLGPEYPLPDAASAIASALLTECFGFASGLVGYSRRGLIDWRIAVQFVATSIPFALGGAILARFLASNPVVLQTVYASLMLGLAAFLIFSPRPDEIEAMVAAEGGECDIPELEEEQENVLGKNAQPQLRGLRTITATDGTNYTYLTPKLGSAKSIGATATGAALTGLLGVGIGEVVLPQLVRKCCMPLPVAAGTSVAIVVLTAISAAIVQFLSLATDLEGSASVVDGLVSVIPWNLVQFTIPGVLVGGQVAPFVASRGWFSDQDIERFATTLFALVGIAFATKALTG